MLDLKADLRSEFSWNTKQLFVYVGARFGTRKNARNDMVLWSSIVEDKVGRAGWLWRGRCVRILADPAAGQLPLHMGSSVGCCCLP